jgi:excisionase family DNA binding protein
MNTTPKITEDEWLSLHEAAGLLGVHPSTVRIWSDKGLLPAHRTPGGHRRFKRSEVLLWANTSRARQPIDPVNVVRAAVSNIRLQISEGRLS